MKKVLLIVGVLIAAAFLWLCKLGGDEAREVIFRGSVMDLPTDQQIMDRYRERSEDGREVRAAHVVLPMEDGTRVSGWLFDRGKRAPLVAVYGGNNMQIGSLLSWALRDKTRSYLMINYRGYGSSEGKPSEKSVVRDAIACLDWASKKIGKPKTVALVGFSLGTGVATQVAAACDPAVLVLICPFDSILNTACDYVPILPYFIVRDRFDSAACAPDLRCRVVILAASRDRVILPERTARLREALGRRHEYHRFDAGHGSIMQARGFLRTLFESLPEGLSPEESRRSWSRQERRRH